MSGTTCRANWVVSGVAAWSVCATIALADLPFEDWKAVGPGKALFAGIVSDPTNVMHWIGIKQASTGVSGTECRCVETTDGGASWMTLTNLASLASVPIVHFSAFDHRRMYFCTSTKGTWRTLDGGRTWTYTNTVLQAISAHPTDSNVVYGAAISWDYDLGGYKFLFAQSVNAGMTWTTNYFFDRTRFAPFESNLTKVNDLTVSRLHPEHLLVCGNLRNTSNGGDYAFAVLSTNAGASWSDISSVVDSQSNSTLRTAIFDPTQEGRMYVAGNRFYASSDGGMSWQNNAAVSNVFALGADPRTSGALYAQYVNATSASPYAPMRIGLFSSKDGGAFWTNCSVAANYYLRNAYVASSLEVMPADASNILMNTGYGFFSSRDAGRTMAVADARSMGRIDTLTVAPSQPSRILVVSENNMFRSDNGGNDWTELVISGRIPDMAFSPTNPDLALYYGEAG